MRPTQWEDVGYRAAAGAGGRGRGGRACYDQSPPPMNEHPRDSRGEGRGLHSFTFQLNLSRI